MNHFFNFGKIIWDESFGRIIANHSEFSHWSMCSVWNRSLVSRVDPPMIKNDGVCSLNLYCSICFSFDSFTEPDVYILNVFDNILETFCLIQRSIVFVSVSRNREIKVFIVYIQKSTQNKLCAFGSIAREVPPKANSWFYVDDGVSWLRIVLLRYKPFLQSAREW